MLGIHSLPLFVASCILLNMTPGQDTMYIMGRSMAQGRRAGVLSVLGIMTGVLIHTLLAAFGLSAVLAASALAFTVVKVAGALYLIWIGIGFLRGSGGDTQHQPDSADAAPGWAVFRQGVLTNVLNPKVSLFFLSFLPQFVDATAATPFLPFLVLGLIFFTTGSIWCLVLVFGATWMVRRFPRRAGWGGVLRRATGLLFVGLGLKLALTE